MTLLRDQMIQAQILRRRVNAILRSRTAIVKPTIPAAEVVNTLQMDPLMQIRDLKRRGDAILRNNPASSARVVNTLQFKRPLSAADEVHAQLVAHVGNIIKVCGKSFIT